MKIKVLGSGGAFSTIHGNTQLFLDTGHHESSLLFDCGETTMYNIAKCKFDWSWIRNIFISHMHPDHVGGLANLGSSPEGKE